MLLTTVRDSVLIITMDRVAKRNAVDKALAAAIDAALARLDDDPDLRVGVLTGGTTVFSAGTDLHEPTSPATPDGGEYGVIRRARRKPLIAAVEGFALGGGFEIVLACDLVVAGRSARFGLPEVARGVIASCGALFRAHERLSPTVAMELLLTGDSIDAARAHALGLVNSVVEDGSAVDTAVALGLRIARHSPAAIAATLRGAREARDALEDSGWSATGRAAAEAAASPDRAEGIAAFFERRAPRWKGLGRS
ncbi:MAG: enoyl-CoA hydratase/isomerase family protein [Burkholderiales bacterium]|nr:enoyl-CoA hydratase/isomerase family protein [Burkholderiales bacterium]